MARQGRCITIECTVSDEISFEEPLIRVCLFTETAMARCDCKGNPVPLRWLRLRRQGVATLDYVLLICVVLPLAGFVMWAGPRIMNLVYEMTCVLISWPFL